MTSNLLFFEIVAIHTMSKYLEQVIESIDANDEKSDEIKEIGSKVTNFTKIDKRMRIKYDEYYRVHEKMNPWVYIAPIFDPRYKLVHLEVSLCELLGQVEGSAIVFKSER